MTFESLATKEDLDTKLDASFAQLEATIDRHFRIQISMLSVILVAVLFPYFERLAALL